MFGPPQMEWFQRLEAEFDNLRAALTWSLLEPAELESGLKLAAALARSSFWNGGYSVEGCEWLDTLLARASPGPGHTREPRRSVWLMDSRLCALGGPGNLPPIVPRHAYERPISSVSLI